jgi:hypothetical protein
MRLPSAIITRPLVPFPNCPIILVTSYLHFPGAFNLFESLHFLLLFRLVPIAAHSFSHPNSSPCFTFSGRLMNSMRRTTS